MVDVKSKSSIPAWQRPQQQTLATSSSPGAPIDGSDVAANQEFDASKVAPQLSENTSNTRHSKTDGSQHAANQEFDASKAALQPSGNPSGVDHYKTDGSQVAAKQEYDASNAMPERLQESENRPDNLAKTDGSTIAANQEFEATKATPDALRESDQSSVNTSKTDGSRLAAKQEFDASKATPDRLREVAASSVDTSKTDGSEIAAEQEFEASNIVIRQVRKFLQDPQVKDAPLEKKRAFLLNKGVKGEIIHQVLGDDQASTTLDPAEFQTARQPPAPKQQPQTDLPPIVTYPEFLMQPQNPPPLVTFNRLINTAYLAGGITATLYGLSKYIIAPMAANLSEARHDLAEHTASHLGTMTDKLGHLVSTIPSSVKLISGTSDSDDTEDLESTVSDPTELFHRDVGTQTSPLATPASESPSNAPPPESESTISRQEARLKILHSHMSELLANSETNATTNDDIATGVDEFRHYLDTMVYSPPAYQYHPGDTVWTPPSTPRGEKKDDAVAAFKTEIRGVKGVLLSAKRFPSAAAAVR